MPGRQSDNRLGSGLSERAGRAVNGLPPHVRLTLEAAVERLIPSEPGSPGAREAGVAAFLERALASDLKGVAGSYRANLEALDHHARIRHGKPFAELTASVRDRLLARVDAGELTGLEPDSSTFFSTLLGHVVEGMFGDPVRGGNRNFAGWDLIGYRGIRLRWSAEEQKLDVDVPAAHRSSGQTAREVWALEPEPPPRPLRRPAPAPADVVVVGLGAAGGTAASRLAEAGLAVTAFEAGPGQLRRGHSFDELEHPGFRHPASHWKTADEVPTHRPCERAAATAPQNPVLMDNGVGGTLSSWAGLWYRYLPWNFAVRSETVRRYGSGAIPPGCTVTDWPVCYEELAPHYDRLEELHGVSGQAGVVRGSRDERGNVFEGSRAAPFPLPPLRRSGWNELMAGAARELGWHPFPGAAAIRSQPYGGLGACTYCGFCRGQRCYARARAETLVTGIPEALASGKLEIVPRARVVAVEVDGDGLATGVRYLRGDKLRTRKAKVVLLAAYTYENVRLLLLSTSRAHPRGLGNRTGQVGKHFMTHSFIRVHGLFPGRNLNRFSGTQAQFTAVDDWNGDNFDHRGLGFLGGSTLIAAMEEKPIAAARTIAPGVPAWGVEYKRWLRANARSVGAVVAQLDVLPYELNYLDLDDTTRDRAGLPVVRCTYDLQGSEHAQAAFLLERAREWLLAAGAAGTWGEGIRAEAVSTHAFGGTRMGDDPDSSVVDPYGFVHDAPNVGVLGASTFPTAGGQNPTATVMALADRTAEHLIGNWSSLAPA